MADLFRPVAPGGDGDHNAVIDRFHEDDHAIAMGFADAADLLIEHWQSRGPNDLLFLPIVFNYRHALELVLKAAIRDAATCLRAAGHGEADLRRERLDDWLSRPPAGHSLAELAARLDSYLQRLDEEQLPPDTHAVLASLHELDPRGDTFRYAKVRDRETKRWQRAPRPATTHVDVVAMGEAFAAAFSLLSGGVITVLDNYREYQQEMAHEAGW